jgi:hypothetical protein
MRRRTPDTGSAVVEFVGVLALLLALFLVIFQLGVVLHIRNVMTAADRTDQEGADRAREAVATGLSARLAQQTHVTPSRDPADPGVVEITITVDAPLFVPKLHPFRITVHGHALEESR